MGINRQNNRAGDYLSPLWQQAAITGSLWGAFEITLGSLLHNMMLPLIAGTTLAFFGVMIISALASDMPRRGFFWRVALVCALLKSVSPSTVILSPMVAIFLEGVLIELAILLLGRNIIGLLIGGGLAVLSVPLFKVARLYMMYGSTLPDLFNMVITNIPFIHSFPNPSFTAMLVVIVFYLVLGALAVLLGRQIASRIVIPEVPIPIGEIESESEHKGILRPLLRLACHLFSLVLYLVAASELPFWAAVLLAIIYIGGVVAAYPGSWVILKRIKIVLPLLLFSLIVPFLLSAGSSGFGWIEAGGRLFLRALLVIFSFSALGRELANPALVDMFSRGMFRPAYYAVSLAFTSLPHYIKLIGSITPSRKGVMGRLKDTIRHAGAERSSGNPNPVFIITGERAQGKTSFLVNLLEALSESNIPYRGFYARGEGPPDLRTGYTLVMVPRGGERLLCKRVGTCGLPSKSFEFDAEALHLGEKWLIEAEPRTLVVLDEIGRIELEGEGWAPLLSRILQNTDNPLLITCRKANLVNTIGHWNLFHAQILDISEVSVKEACNTIAGHINSWMRKTAVG